MKTTPRQFASALGLMLGFAAALPAQQVARDAATDTTPVQLETFIVDTEKDNGYIAVDSLAGGRTATPIKLTPASMSSLTRTFIDDVGINDIRESLQWSANVIPSDYNAGKTGSPYNDFDFNFRGAGQSLQGGAGPTRNYFTYYQSGDTYNVERIEFDRGPNSILFGIGTVGGVLSTYTKQARLDKDFTTPQLVLDSNGSKRLTIDANRRFGDKFALRVNALVERREGWMEQDVDTQRALDLALTYQLTDRTSLRFDGEISRSKVSLVRSGANDSVSRYDGAASNTWGASPLTSTGTASPSTATGRMDGGAFWSVYIPDLPDLGINNWNVGYRSRGFFLPMAPVAGWYPSSMTNGTLTIDGATLPVRPSAEFTIAAKDAYAKPEYETFTLWLSHRFTEDLELAVTGYYYDDSRYAQNYEGIGDWAYDINKQLPNGQPNPKFGKRYGDFMASAQNQERAVQELRAQLTYKLDRQLFGQPYKQIFSISAGHQDITWKARQYNAQIFDVPGMTGGAGGRIVRARIYEDNLHPTIGLPPAVGSYITTAGGVLGGALVKNTGNYRVAYAPHDSNWFDFDEDYTLKNIAAFTHMRMFDDKLSILLGARRDTYSQYRINAIIPTTTMSDASGTTYSSGAVYYLGPVGLFANYSKNFEPIGPGRNPSLAGEPFKATTGAGTDMGLRFSSKNGKYYVTATYYDAKSRDRITGNKIGFGNIWNQYYDARGLPRDPVLGSLAYDDTQSLHVKGYEFEITANPTSNLRLQASYSLPKSQIIEAMAGQRAYFASNFAAWDSAANLTINPTASTNLRTALNNGKLLLDNNVAGANVAGVAKYIANFFANYTFTNDTLKGFSVGAGFTHTDRQFSTIIRGTTYYRAARDSTNLALGYATKFNGIPTNFRLNVSNVFDDTDPIITSYDGSWRDSAGVAIPNGYTLPAPRLVRFSVQFTF